jgi:CspA family cold shock protein
VTGTIARILPAKGFGFITGEDGRDYFVHRSAFSDGPSLEEISEGQAVTFDVVTSSKGPRAENVRVTDNGREDCPPRTSDMPVWRGPCSGRLVTSWPS